VKQRIQLQASYGDGGSCILESTSNYIFYQEVETFEGDLTKLVQDFVNSPTEISKFVCTQ
jgi:hypothetical protein